MTDIPTIARKNASTIEVKKHAYRQTQDGIVISFVMHPNDVTPALATAALGTRYMAALVEIGDDDQPKQQPTAAIEPTAPPRESKRSWHDMNPAQQAGILCADPAFRRFMFEEGSATTMDEGEVTEAVREICGVGSRADIIQGSPAACHWADLVGQYRAWRMVPV